jgi:hypothetical protein
LDILAGTFGGDVGCDRGIDLFLAGGVGGLVRDRDALGELVAVEDLEHDDEGESHGSAVGGGWSTREVNCEKAS